MSNFLKIWFHWPLCYFDDKTCALCFPTGWQLGTSREQVQGLWETVASENDFYFLEGYIPFRISVVRTESSSTSCHIVLGCIQ